MLSLVVLTRCTCVHFLFQDSEIALEKDDVVSSKSLLYNFHLKSGELDVAVWMAVLQNEKLYVEVPQGEIPPGAKEWYVHVKPSTCMLP